jgi:hypothetical protein
MFKYVAIGIVVAIAIPLLGVAYIEFIKYVKTLFKK